MSSQIMFDEIPFLNSYYRVEAANKIKELYNDENITYEVHYDNGNIKKHKLKHLFILPKKFLKIVILDKIYKFHQIANETLNRNEITDIYIKINNLQNI